MLPTDGNFYGTTAYGGANGNYGTVFRITPGGELTTLYSFCALTGCADRSIPAGPLVQGKDGNLYGMTSDGGRYDGVNCVNECGGTAFRSPRESGSPA